MQQAVPIKRGRGGRPPAGSAGDVEARLLAAATRLFLERGYDGTSCDQVALDARAGKAITCNMQSDATRNAIEGFLGKQPLPDWPDRKT